MNDTAMSIVAIFLAAILMFIFPLMSTADRTDDISQQAVQTATTEFVVSTIAETGNSYDVEIEAQKLDETSRKKTAIASQSKVGENNYYSEYTSQIESELGSNGEYDLKEGDLISVTVKNTNKTISQILKNFFYSVTGNNTYNIAAQHSGIVNVNAK